ncbi:hypothetical protein F511_09861 [Dorcoceras hygrometricum]|uniref:Uncharacterized protein n=1 Tax=Dorcoceras hygrometricum TaxID=472368 RepID=A0A2Z7CD20_9LAMI|nr:hypothetical protein F511_09861 [Dorcoceras hygrometricum]
MSQQKQRGMLPAVCFVVLLVAGTFVAECEAGKTITLNMSQWKGFSNQGEKVVPQPANRYTRGCLMALRCRQGRRLLATDDGI